MNSELVQNPISEPCRICGSLKTASYKKGIKKNSIHSSDFKITDSSYGRTLELSQCKNCEFVQAQNIENLLSMYEEMEDLEYQKTMSFRRLQFEKIFEICKSHFSGKTLLDIGTGAGEFLDVAQKNGYQSMGVEPSRWLANLAIQRNLNIVVGEIENLKSESIFDIITLVDVIEHVNDPKKLISDSKKYLKFGGQILVITPDLSSLFARLLGSRWWHFRVAHVGYFNQTNLDLLMNSQGFKLKFKFRPTWYFPIGYILDRLKNYKLGFLKKVIPKVFWNYLIPLQLYDSIGCIYEKVE